MKQYGAQVPLFERFHSQVAVSVLWTAMELPYRVIFAFYGHIHQVLRYTIQCAPEDTEVTTKIVPDKWSMRAEYGIGTIS